MSFSFLPRYAFRKFAVLTPDALKKLGIRFLMLDLDNTIAKYNEHSPAEAVTVWVEDMKKNGVELFIISNSKRESRVDTFSEALGIDFIKNARKPSPKSLLQTMTAKGYGIGESAIMGDQIFTDTLAGNRAGIVSMIVWPLSLKNPLHLIRFVVEIPFRAACAIKRARRRGQSL